MTDKQTTYDEYFSTNPLSCNWFDIVNPNIILSLPAIELGSPQVTLSDRHAIKAAFKGFGIVTNEADGLRVTFPAASAGKMLYQSGTDIRTIAASFKFLFEKSRRAWDEREVPMPGHKFHFNVSAYRNYICKFRINASEYFIRFTIRKVGQDSSVHASTISEVAIYRKTEGIPADSHLENPEDGHRMPFIDNKIAHYLSACQLGTLS